LSSSSPPAASVPSRGNDGRVAGEQRGAHIAPLLSESEWQALGELRSGRSIADVARGLGVDQRSFRRLVAHATEKLRVAASLPSPPRSSGLGKMQVPDLVPCPYCEIFAGRYPEHHGPPAVITA